MSAVSTIAGHGVRLENRNQLALVRCPDPTDTWFPVSHLDVANTVVSKLRDSGYYILNESWVLSGSEHARMFGVIDLMYNVYGDDVTLAVGVRNSLDKSCAMGFCAGSRVSICTNLSFSSEIMVSRKHTLNGSRDYQNQISETVGNIKAFAANEYKRYNRWMYTKVSKRDRDEIILLALESGVYPKAMLPDIFREQVRPSYAEFNDGTVWGMFNNFTTVMQPRGIRRPDVLSKSTQDLVRIIESRIFSDSNVIDITPENN